MQKRVVVGHQMGLGKTAIMIDALKHTDSPVRVGLIFCPKLVYSTWVRELHRWWSDDIPVIRIAGNRSERFDAWDKFDEAISVSVPGVPVFAVATYANMEEIVDAYPKWDAVIFDECHAYGLRNRKGKMHKLAKRFRAPYLFLASGTPAPKHPVEDLWPYLNLIHPRTFTSFWRFAEENAHTYKGWGRGYVVGEVLDPKAYREKLAPYIRRRLKAEVRPDMPPKIRTPWYVDMLPMQRRLYDEMAEEMMVWLDEETQGFKQGDPRYREIVLAKNVISRITRLRQICVTPALIGGKPESAALDMITEFAVTAGEPLAVYTAFTQAIPFIGEVLMEAGYVVYPLSGKVKDEVLFRNVEDFEKSKEKRRAIVAQTKMGMGFDLISASHCIFVGIPWATDECEQCEDRHHRIGQNAPTVNCYYILNNYSVEKDIQDVLGKKKRWSDLILDYRRFVYGDEEQSQGTD